MFEDIFLFIRIVLGFAVMGIISTYVIALILINIKVVREWGFPISNEKIEEALKPRRLLYTQRVDRVQVIRTDLEGFDIKTIDQKVAIGLYVITHVGLIPRWSKWHRYIQDREIPSRTEYEMIKERKRRRREANGRTIPF